METLVIRSLGDKIPIHAEVAEWNPKDAPLRWNAKQPKRSRTRSAIDALKVGDCIRLYHPDVACQNYGGSCSVMAIIATKRRDYGWEIEAYHEDRYIAVVRRTR